MYSIFPVRKNRDQFDFFKNTKSEKIVARITFFLSLCVSSFSSHGESTNNYFDPNTYSSLEVFNICNAAYAGYISGSAQCTAIFEDGRNIPYFSVLNAIHTDPASGDTEAVTIAWHNSCSNLTRWTNSDFYAVINCTEHKYYPTLNEAPNNGQDCNNTKNPINIATGNKYYSDLIISSKPIFLQSYNSLAGGWQFSYMQKLIIDENSVLAHRDDGKTLFFEKVDGQFRSRSNRREKLVFETDTYTLIFANGKRETYDSNGKLIAVEEDYQEKIQVSYVDDKILVSQAGRNLELTVSSGRLTEVVLSGEIKATYIYDTVNNVKKLSSVIYQDGSDINYSYEDSRFPTFVTGIEDELGYRVSSVQYDDQGRAVVSEKFVSDLAVERTEIEYNPGGVRVVTNSLGKKSTYHFSEFNSEYKVTLVEGHSSDNCAAANKNYNYDTNGFLVSKTDWNNNLIVYVRDDNGRELSRTEAFGTPQARTIQTDWHPDFSKPIKIIEPERTTEYTYDAQGRLLNSKVTPTP